MVITHTFAVRKSEITRRWIGAMLLWCIMASLCSCQPTRPPAAPAAGPGSPLCVLTTMTFLADMAQHVVGDELEVRSLIPADVDPHSFEPAPADIVKVSQCGVLIINGAHLEAFLDNVLQNVDGQRTVIEASRGLKTRPTAEGGAHDAEHEGDPHFWLDPNLAIVYVENIRAGLSEVDPSRAETYQRNASAYIAQLKELDAWIAQEVSQIPQERRLLITNHESLGYFADRYGFRVVGTIIPSVTTGSSPSAKELADLISHIRETQAPAIFLESGTNPQLAKQVASETGVQVVTDLYTHSVGIDTAPTYIDMMRRDTTLIVQALK